MNKKFLIWESMGILMIMLIMTLLHFGGDLLGIKICNNFCAVNESVWEHMKIAFFAILFYSIIEWFFIGKHFKNFWFTKSLELLFIPFLIMIIFYTYSGILGKNYLALDILTALISIIIGQFVSYSLVTSQNNWSSYNAMSAILIFTLILMYILFTYYPPQINLFKDTNTDSYGIQSKSKL